MGEAGFTLKGQAWGTGPRTEREQEGSGGLCPLVPKRVSGAAPHSLAPVSCELGTPCPRRSLNQAWRLRAGLPHPLGVRRAPGARGRPLAGIVSSCRSPMGRPRAPGGVPAAPEAPPACLLFVLRLTDTRTQGFGPLDVRPREGESMVKNSELHWISSEAQN